MHTVHLALKPEENLDFCEYTSQITNCIRQQNDTLKVQFIFFLSKQSSIKKIIIIIIIIITKKKKKKLGIFLSEDIGEPQPHEKNLPITISNTAMKG